MGVLELIYKVNIKSSVDWLEALRNLTKNQCRFIRGFALPNQPIWTMKISKFLKSLALKTQPLNILYVTSLGSDEILKYNGDTGELLGTFILPRPELDAPDGFVFGSDGNVYVSGFYSDNVVKYSCTGEFLGVFASNVDGAAQLLFDPDGNLLVASYGDEQTACGVLNSCSIHKFDGKTGAFLGLFASKINGADGLTIGPDGHLYVSAFLGNQILKYDIKTGQLLDTVISANPLSAQIFKYDVRAAQLLNATASSGSLSAPDGLTFGPDGNLYFANWGTNEVLRYNPKNGSVETFASGGGLSLPNRIAFGLDNNLYVSSLGSDAILKYDGNTGIFLETFISGVKQPTDIVFITTPKFVSIFALFIFAILDKLNLYKRKK